MGVCVAFWVAGTTGSERGERGKEKKERKEGKDGNREGGKKKKGRWVKTKEGKKRENHKMSFEQTAGLSRKVKLADLTGMTRGKRSVSDRQGQGNSRRVQSSHYNERN